MTTGDQEDQAEKLRVTLQDADVRRQQQHFISSPRKKSFLAAGSPPLGANRDRLEASSGFSLSGLQSGVGGPTAGRAAVRF
jgi:hypothetical protein